MLFMLLVILVCVSVGAAARTLGPHERAALSVIALLTAAAYFLVGRLM